MMIALKFRTWKVKALRELRVRMSGMVDAALFFLRIPPRVPPEAKVGGALFYVAELLMARAGRLAKWVTRLSGRKVVLLCHAEGFIPEFAEGFTAIVRYRNGWHLRRLLRTMPEPWLIHGFAPKSHYPDVARRAMRGVPYVHDLQDTLVVYYGTAPTKRWLRVELPYEKACMAGADGVIAHSLEPAEGFRRYGIPRGRRPPTLFFPLYCDDDRFVGDVPKVPGKAIHLVYAGGVAGSHRDPRYFGHIQFFGLIRTLAEQGLHLHIYPSPTTLEADRLEYVELARTNPWFHYHEPVAQEALAGELARYHFGLIPFFVQNSDQSPEKLKYATALKLFNFIEAGLPVVVSGDLEFQGWISRRAHAGVVVASDGLGTLAPRLEAFDGSRLAAGRTSLSLGAQVPRLLSFYAAVRARAGVRHGSA